MTIKVNEETASSFSRTAISKDIHDFGKWDWPEWSPQANSIRWAERVLQGRLAKTTYWTLFPPLCRCPPDHCLLKPSQATCSSRERPPLPITQSAASASASTTTVTDKGSVQHETECLACIASKAQMSAVSVHTCDLAESSSPPDAGVVNETEATLAEIRERRRKLASVERDEWVSCYWDIIANAPSDIDTLLGIIGGLQSDLESAEHQIAPMGAVFDATFEIQQTHNLDPQLSPAGVIRELSALVNANAAAASNMKTLIVKRVREIALRAHAGPGITLDLGSALDQLATELEAIEPNDLSGK